MTGVAATVRRFEGALCVIVFDEPAPHGFRKVGGWLSLTQNGLTSVGCVLPLGDARRIILRVDGGCTHMTGGAPILVAFAGPDEVPGLPPLDVYDNLRVLSQWPDQKPMFSVVTLLRNEVSYRRMLRSYRDYGFTPENTEFIAIDNRGANLADGYQGARLALSQAMGRYLIFCHDDVELLQDNFDDLCQRLATLEALDPRWMVAGMAGGVFRQQASATGRNRVASRLSDRWGAGRRVCRPFPRQVESLDEMFLLMPRLRAPQSSIDLSGFHFFGTDLCLQAELAGGSAYVIDFHLFHHGTGHKGPDYWEQKARIEAKYRPYFPGRIVVTSTQPLQF
ncbi:MAG: hypothetical protein HC783_10925 [Rhodobacteraceae bacterium]|nr:hypothetical protein [Paracoccaceae bacterium]